MNIWVEKYRPKNIDELIFPDEFKKKFKKYMENDIPNIGLFSSIPGTGKTSLAYIIKNELKTETLWLNGSKENNIDTFRYKVSDFASKVSMNGKYRLIIIDESDYLTSASQALLRNDIESFYHSARFIFTGNYPDRIIEPLLQRLEIYNFDEIFKEHKKELAKQIYEKLVFILQNENIEYNKEDIIKIIKAFYPSVREMIMFIQKNVIDSKLKFTKIDNTNLYLDILSEVKNKNFIKLKELIEEISNPEIFYNYMWKNLENLIEGEDLLKVSILLSDYYEQHQKAKNKYIPLLAFLVKLMKENVKIKI